MIRIQKRHAQNQTCMLTLTDEGVKYFFSICLHNNQQNNQLTSNNFPNVYRTTNDKSINYLQTNFHDPRGGTATEEDIRHIPKLNLWGISQSWQNQKVVTPKKRNAENKTINQYLKSGAMCSPGFQ